jgi:hypothetical protein
VFLIRGILKRARILESVHWITERDLTQDPDANFFVSGFQETNKKSVFSEIFLLEDTFASVFKDNKSLRSHKTVEIKVFLYFFLVDRWTRIPDPHRY